MQLLMRAGSVSGYGESCSSANADLEETLEWISFALASLLLHVCGHAGAARLSRWMCSERRSRNLQRTELAHLWNFCRWWDFSPKKEIGTRSRFSSRCRNARGAIPGQRTAFAPPTSFRPASWQRASSQRASSRRASPQWVSDQRASWLS